jgi:peptidoglycan/xylan/chitin deacetylase (PgdA/CDA1 family)
MASTPARIAATLRVGLKGALLGAGFPTVLLRRFDRTIVLFYHAIGEDGVPASAFERQVAYCRRHFEVIVASEIDRPSPSSRLRVAITFDDGLRNTRDVALPILRKLGARATLFALPGDVSWLWTAEMRERLGAAVSAGIAVYGYPRLRDRRDIDRVIEEMKTMSQDDFLGTLERLRALTRFEPSPAWRKAHELMSADELRALPPEVIEIGAHTLTHPILTHVDDAWLEREIVEGKQRLEGVLQRPVTSFSYPNGAFDRRCLEIAARHYDYAFTTETAIGDYQDQAALDGHAHAINRLHGVDHQADMPLRMLHFLRQGHGFRARALPPRPLAALPGGEEAPGYEMHVVVQK